MGVQLSSSVGNVHANAPWRKGSAPPGNKAVDQKKIIGVLASIPSAQGGMKEAWSRQPQPGPDGMCLDELADAIWNFQSFWKANGTFKNIDGVVDPGGNTLRVLNSCALGQQVREGGPNALNPANLPNLDKLASEIRQLLPYPTRWTLDNAPGAGGGSGDFSFGIGQLDMVTDGGEKRFATFVQGGLSISKSALDTPVTFSASTRDMWSATSIKALSGMGRVFSRVPNVSFEDMLGPMIICTISGAAPSTFYSTALGPITKSSMSGLAFTLFFLNAVPGEGGPMALIQPDVMALAKAALRSKAVCMSAGACMGFDVSASIGIGYAVVDKKRDIFDSIEPIVPRNPTVDSYKKQAEDMWDQGINKIKDWSPF